VHAPWGPHVLALHDPQWMPLPRVQQVVAQRLGLAA
jgi:hypothetical protein